MTDAEVDASLVSYSNAAYLHGHRNHVGTRLLAALLDRVPAFERGSYRQVPIFHRSL